MLELILQRRNDLFMKKFITIVLIFFWSMIFPQLSFNCFTTQIISDDITYSDLTNPQKRQKVLQNAEFELFTSSLFNSK